MKPPIQTEPEIVRAPVDTLGQLFLRFLRFGALAWGGPVAQIDMIRQELVTEEKWITPGQFKRLLAIYQALPGPEAHELCVHFGMIARGRWGGVVAGLGFMLPGFGLMFLLSWLYLTAGLSHAAFAAIFLGIQPAVVALIVRAVHRIGGHSLTDAPLWVIGILAALGEALGVSFWITLPLAGLGYVAGAARRWVWAAGVAVAFGVATALTSPVIASRAPLLPHAENAATAESRAAGPVSPVALFGSGLRAGLLTFGGAYTAIPFLREDAVERGRWMSERDFLDGVALSGVLPAPLIIFSTFVGYVGGGPLGALAITLGVFLPAFGFSLLFFRQLESAMANPLLKHFLEDVTAGVVGLIAVTAARLALTTLTTPVAATLFVAALAMLWRWNSRWAVPAVILGAGVAGWVLAR